LLPRILNALASQQPDPSELGWQRYGDADGGILDREPGTGTTCRKLLRMTAAERIAGERRCRWDIAQQLAERIGGADADVAALGLECRHVAVGPRQQPREARPARRGLRRAIGDDEQRPPVDHAVGMSEIFLAPDVLRSEVLHVLDAALRHFPARGPHPLEAHRVRVELALQI